MRLEKIRFINLASLRGEWRIDLTESVFQDAGIFALSGPVGSGKTTVFDAVRLALFGQTNRLPRISKNENEIMTRGTDDCLAELIFSNDQGRFLCRWSQHRAKSGQLQNAKHLFARFKDDSDETEILTSKLEETRERIRSVIRMDFKHFSRAMILPQGQFASFLQAGAEERAPILEQITGTGIYAEISMKVYETCRELELELKTLEESVNGVELVPGEQTAEWEMQLEKARFAALETKKNYDLKTELLRSRKTLETECSGLRHLQIQFPAAERDRDLAQKALEESEAVLTEAGRKREELAPLLLRIREMDSEIRMRSAELAEHDRSFVARSAGYESDLLLQEKNLRNLNEKTASLDSIRLFLTEHSADSQLAGELGGLRLRFERRNALFQECDSLRKRIGKMESAKEKQRKKADSLRLAVDAAGKEFSISKIRLEERLNDLKTLSGDRSIPEFFAYKDELRKKTETLERMHSLLDREEKNRIALLEKKRTLEANAEQRKQIAGRLDSEKNLEKQIAGNLRLLEEKRIAEAKIASYETDRNALRPGSPCPLCGSGHHPYAERKLELCAENALESVRSTLETAKQSISALEKESVRLNLVAETLENESELLRAEAAEIAGAWNAFPRTADGGEHSAPGFRESLENALRNASAEFNHCNTLAALIDAKNRERSAAETELQRAGEVLTKSSFELKSAEAELLSLSSLLEQAETDRNEKIKEAQTADSALRSLLSGYDIDSGIVFDDAFLQLEKRATDYASAGRNAVELEKEIIRLKSGTQSEAERLEKEKAELRNHRSDGEKRKTDLAALKLVRSNEFGERSPDAEEKAAKHAVLSAETGRKECAEVLKKAQEQYASLCTRIADSQGRIRTLEEWISARNGMDVTLESLESEIAELDCSRQEQERGIGELLTLLDRAAKARNRAAGLLNSIAEKRKLCGKWEYLNSLIGSADGKKYREFVQSLTLETLIVNANEQLRRFSGRYTLIADPETGLRFNVRDAYRGNEIRSSQNLSGGETFLVSLALALGLSRMARNPVRIDTLFLDEGFGTLDEETLQHALEQLAGLRQSGKLIGIITHAHGIEDAVPVVLRFTNCAGHSAISGPGVSRKGDPDHSCSLTPGALF